MTHNRSAVENWVIRETHGAVVHLDEEVYEGWLYLAERSLDDLMTEVSKSLAEISD